MTRVRQFLAACALLIPAALAQAASGRLVEIDGPIGPAMSWHLQSALEEAATAGSDFVILRIDTPGGLDGAMRDMIQAILAAKMPVIGFVAPEGARAASAGTYLLYACHLAAMAPATNLGAATPIPLGGVPTPLPRPAPEPEEDDGDSAGEAPPPADAAGRKIVNDAVAYIRALAEKRGRNAEWAEKAVREGASLSARAALEAGVIDLLAADLDDLLAAADGREVMVAGAPVTLATAGAALETVEPDWRTEFLAIVTNPTVAYMLLLLGVYGLLLEGYNPGAILPGVVGAISLLLALYALQILPVNYAGLGLILLGLILIIAEALVPSFGVLGFGGIAAFIFGSIMLMDADVPGYEINLLVIAGIAAGAAALMLLTVILLMRSRHAAVVTGDCSLIGHRAQVLSFADGHGWARAAGERWQIRADCAIEPGQTVEVRAIDGLILDVRPIGD